MKLFIQKLLPIAVLSLLLNIPTTVQSMEWTDATEIIYVRRELLPPVDIDNGNTLQKNMAKIKRNVSKKLKKIKKPNRHEDSRLNYFDRIR